jgi:hypothetical protein
MPFVLTHGSSHVEAPTSVDPESALKATEEFWTEWSARNTSQGEWDEAVMRSLITLKALTYAPTGGLVAAATSSLPEQIGGTRNWDYRYCWLRDATLTLLALMNAATTTKPATGACNAARRSRGASAAQIIRAAGNGGFRDRDSVVAWLREFHAGSRRQFVTISCITPTAR